MTLPRKGRCSRELDCVCCEQPRLPSLPRSHQAQISMRLQPWPPPFPLSVIVQNHHLRNLAQDRRRESTIRIAIVDSVFGRSRPLPTREKYWSQTRIPCEVPEGDEPMGFGLTHDSRNWRVN